MQSPIIKIDTLKPIGTLVDLTGQFNARVGDAYTPITIQWTEGGNAKNLDGLHPVFEAVVGQGHVENNEVIMNDDAVPVRWVGDQSSIRGYGQTILKLPPQVFSKSGLCYGYLALENDQGVRETSVDIWFKVLGGVYNMGLACNYFITDFQKAIATAEEDLRNSKKSMQTVVDEFTSNMNDLTNRLETQATNGQAALDALEAKIKQEGFFTKAEADTFKQAIKSKIADLNKQVTSLEANTPYFKLADYKTGTNSWQDAVDAVLALKTSAYNIALPKDQAVTTDIIISKPGVSLIGGVLSGAQLILDYQLDSNENTMCSVDHVRFTGGNDGIKIIKAPYVRIANCYFGNTGVGIRIASDVNKDGFQPSRRLIITGNHFNGCSYGLYSADATNQFGASGDVVFTANQVDVKIGGIHSENVDGHTITNNVFYMPGNSDRDMNKLDNIYLQNAHFTVIQGNSCFEAGRNGIRLIDCTNVSVLDNQIDWPGQNTPASGIYFEYSLSGEIMGRISGNQIVYPTKYGIETPATNGMLDVSDNMIVATGDGRYYSGSESLDNYAPHYNVYAPNMNGSKFSGNMAFAVNNNQSQWHVNNVNIASNYLSDILNYSDRVSVKDFSRSNIVYRAVLHQTLSGSYQMTKDDFNTKVGGPDVGAYLIYIVPWAEEATVESYIAAYSGGITTQSSLTKTFSGESKTQISVDGDTIKFTGTGLVVIIAI